MKFYNGVSVRKDKTMNNCLDKLCGMDKYGRVVKTQNGSKTDKTVGMFYFCWLEKNNGPIIDIQRMLDSNPDETLWNLKGPDESPYWAFHYWGEPLFGYYDCEDPYITKKHIEMLTMAGIDYIACDCTNAIIYAPVYLQLLQTIDHYQKLGWKVPKLCAYTNSSSPDTIRTLYACFYEKKNLYPDAWYAPNGKPVVIARLDENDPLDEEIANTFEFWKSQWPNEEIKDDGFPWMEWIWPQYNHNGTMSVSVAQHSKGTFFQCEGNWGRGYDHKGNDNHDSFRLGQNFQAQWDTAINNPVNNVFVTGWNEWVAQKIFLGEREGIVFVDCFNEEYSRDIEPMKGGYEDAFYLQLIRNVRNFKGQGENTEHGTLKTIDIYSDKDQWSDVNSTYLAVNDENYGRSFSTENPEINYQVAPAKNNIKEIKVCHDSQFIYFRIQTENDITERFGSSWMNLFIGAGDPSEKGWETYTHVANRRAVGSFDRLNMAGTAITYRNTNISVKGNVMQLKISRETIGALGDCKNIHFKVADSVENIRDINDYYVTGKSVPMGRLSYSYNF